MKKVLLSLLLISSLFSQANRILTLAPTSQVSSIGNVTLPYMNPARNLFKKDEFSFSKVNWMTNIVNDMNYNFINFDRGEYGLNILFFNYGDQLIADETGIVDGQFSPSSAVYGFNYARKVSKFNLGLDVKFITHDLLLNKAKGFILGVGGYFPKVYKDLDVDVMLQNFGMAPKFGGVKSELPTSLNIGFSYPYKDWMLYGQNNFHKDYYTFGSGVSYNYKNMLWGKAGYYGDLDHELLYPTFGLDFKYDKYVIGMSYIYGNRELPLSNTIRLTINLEL